MNPATHYDRLWHKRVKALGAVLPEVLDGDVGSLHKARVASRRLREALPVIAAAAPEEKVKKLGRRIRELTRLLGPLRELDVELALLDNGVAGVQASDATVATVRREVSAERRTLRHSLKADRRVKDAKRLLKKLQALGEHHGSGDGKKARKREEARRDALAARLLRRAKRLAASLETAGPLYVTERVHGVRVSTKKLRYALEVAREAGVAGAAALIHPLKKHQDRLGRLHNLEALLRHVRKAEADRTRGARMGDLNAYAEALEQECRRLHADFVEGRQVLIDSVQQIRNNLVPALTTDARRQARVTEPRVRNGAQEAPAARVRHGRSA